MKKCETVERIQIVEAIQSLTVSEKNQNLMTMWLSVKKKKKNIGGYSNWWIAYKTNTKKL